MSEMPRRRLNRQNALTIVSAAILVGTEVFVAGIAGGWAIAGLLGLGDIGAYVLVAVGFGLACFALISFLRSATKVEPIFDR